MRRVSSLTRVSNCSTLLLIALRCQHPNRVKCFRARVWEICFPFWYTLFFLHRMLSHAIQRSIVLQTKQLAFGFPSPSLLLPLQCFVSCISQLLPYRWWLNFKMCQTETSSRRWVGEVNHRLVRTETDGALYLLCLQWIGLSLALADGPKDNSRRRKSLQRNCINIDSIAVVATCGPWRASVSQHGL